MLTYRRVPQCRICMHPEGAQIDQALVEQQMSYGGIVNTFGHLFSADQPLTKGGIYNHFKHMKEAATEVAALLGASGGVVGPPALNPGNPPQPPERQEIFQTLVREQLDEIQIMQDLVRSSLNELEALTPPDLALENPKTDLDVKLARAKIRKDTAAITAESAKIKKMAADSLEDQRRLEKSRIVFRLFDLMKKALEVVPAEFRPLVAEKLKDGFRNDDELRDLLKVHREAVAPAGVPPTTTE